MYVLLQSFYISMNATSATKTWILADFCLIFWPRRLRQVAAKLKLFLEGKLVLSDPRKKYVVCRTLPQPSGRNFVRLQK